MNIKMIGGFPSMAGVFYDYFAGEDNRPPVTEVTFAPSYLNACKRSTYYKKTNTEVSNPIDLPSRFKMNFGSVQHEKLQDILKEIGIMKECEDRKTIDYEGVTFNYYLDGILEVEGQEYILEIKTIYGAAFRMVENSPKDDHLIQTLSYMKFENIKKAIIVYIGRDNGLIRQHVIEENDGLKINGIPADHWLVTWEEKVKSLTQLKQDIENKNMPERDYTIALKNYNGIINDNFTKDKVKYKSDWQCSYCSYKDRCWKSELEEIKTKKFYIDGEFIDE